MKVILPEGFKYDCVRCGKGCFQPWNIPVAEEVHQDLKDKNLQAEGYQPFRQMPDGRFALNHRGPEGCVFLTPEKLCKVHSELGYDRKPLMCRQFPFYLSPTPDGYYVGLSFFCTSIQQGTGQPLEGHRAEMESLAEELAVRMEYDQEKTHVEVMNGAGVDWEGYKAFEARLRENWGPDNLEDLVIRTALGMNGLEDNEERRQRMEIVLEDNIGQVVANVEAAADTEKRAAVKSAYPQQQPFFSVRLGRQIKLYAQAKGFEKEIHRYLDHVVFRKFLTHGQLFGRLLFLLVVKRLLERYTELSARGEGREATIEDFHKAMDVVEMQIMLHSVGYEPVFEWLIEDFQELVAV